MKYKIAKGTFDILPFDPDPTATWRSSHLWQYLEEIMRTTANTYGFREIRTPCFESEELFHRTIGDHTDIVSKEMYTFLDKASRKLALRPEATASVLRSYIEKSLHQYGNRDKFFYILPMFRYERQQKGRYRQHHQFGVEALGSSSPYQDAEVIALLFNILTKLGLKNCNLKIQSLGSKSAREAYKVALKESLQPHLQDLSENSQQRFIVNPLRILDSKDPKDHKFFKQIPKLSDFLTQEDLEHFDQLLSILQDLDIPYQIDPLLVRGLDYYNRTVFEVTTSHLGSQDALGGGGRYDELVEEIGGPKTPAVGFGAGIERILQLLLAQEIKLPQPKTPDIYFIPMGEKAEQKAFSLTEQFRQINITSEMALEQKKLKVMLKKADQLHSKLVVILGDQEMINDCCTIKWMHIDKEKKIQLSKIIQEVQHELSHT